MCARAASARQRVSTDVSTPARRHFWKVSARGESQPCARPSEGQAAPGPAKVSLAPGLVKASLVPGLYLALVLSVRCSSNQAAQLRITANPKNVEPPFWFFFTTTSCHPRRRSRTRVWRRTRATGRTTTRRNAMPRSGSRRARRTTGTRSSCAPVRAAATPWRCYASVVLLRRCAITPAAAPCIQSASWHLVRAAGLTSSAPERI